MQYQKEENITWNSAVETSIKLAYRSVPVADSLRWLATDCLCPDYVEYCPAKNELHLPNGYYDDWRKKASAIASLTEEKDDNIWLKIKFASSVKDIFGQLSGWGSGPVTSVLGGPNTFTAALGSGLLSAGLGYGAGTLAENISPETFQKGKLRKHLGIAGLVAGSAPAIWAGHREFFKPPSTELPAPELNKAAEDLDQLIQCNIGKWIEKEADDMLEAGGAEFAPRIPVDQFNRAILQDSFTPVNIQQGAIGLVRGAERLRGDASPWISPSDITRIVVGLGSGYLAGSIVGRSLGALAGLSEPAQRSIQQSGVWAGFLKTVIPLAFQ